MKRIIFVLLLALLAATGCGTKEEPAAPPDSGPVQVQKEKVPAIISADVPERNPFVAEEGRENEPPEAGEVPEEGRNPFAAAFADDGWEAEAGDVSTRGRDPFQEGSDDSEPPVIEPPGPGEDPTDPGEPGEPPAAGDVRLIVTALDRCWLDVFVDEERVLRTNVPMGETLQWQGETVDLAQVGRQWALNVTVNGEDLGVIEDLVEDLARGPVMRGGVRIQLDMIYPGGVLVGLRFSAIE